MFASTSTICMIRSSQINSLGEGRRDSQAPVSLAKPASPRLSASVVTDHVPCILDHSTNDCAYLFPSDTNSGDVITEPLEEGARGSMPRGQRVHLSKRDGSEDSEVTICASSETLPASRPCGANPHRASRGRQPSSLSKQESESAGHYATNLAESVLQDAFIRLSQDTPSFTTEAAVSVSAGTRTEDLPHARTRSFELPKIVIVQSPDSCEGAAEWPGSMSSNTTAEQDSAYQPPGFEPCPLLPGHSPKAVELALACAANVIGTISSPQVTEQLALEREPEEEEETEGKKEDSGEDYSISSAVCSMAQMVGAVAVLDLTGGKGEPQGTCPPDETYSPSVGLLSAAQASTAITLHCNIAEGTTIQPFSANIAAVLLNEASAVLHQTGEYKSIAGFLESTQHKIVEAIDRKSVV